MTSFKEWLLLLESRKPPGQFLVYVLRHNPGDINIELDSEGWANVDDLIKQWPSNRGDITRKDLEEMVRTDDKKRLEFKGEKIRASQGHSTDVDWDLGYPPEEPPNVLYHGTVDENIESIRRLGLEPQKRHAVHLSRNVEEAINVGGRRGNPIVLTIQSGEMHKDGYEFVVSKNGVWLTKMVPVEYIDFPEFKEWLLESDREEISIADLIMTKEEISDAVSNLSRGLSSVATGPLTVNYHESIGRFELTNGYHRVVEALMSGKKVVPIKNDGAATWEVPKSELFVPDFSSEFFGMEDFIEYYELKRLI